jgi:hypothetical protein
MRLYFDEDASEYAVIRNLRARGIDVTSAIEEGRCGFSDPEQLAFATEQGRVICTSNLGDFIPLHTESLSQGKSHTGIILIHQQRFSVGQQILRLLRLMETKSAEEMQNRIEFLSNW